MPEDMPKWKSNHEWTPHRDWMINNNIEIKFNPKEIEFQNNCNMMSYLAEDNWRQSKLLNIKIKLAKKQIALDKAIAIAMEAESSSSSEEEKSSEEDKHWCQKGHEMIHLIAVPDS